MQSWLAWQSWAELSWRITTLSRRDEEAAVLCQGYDMINLSSRVKVKHESKQFPSSDDCCSVWDWFISVSHDLSSYTSISEKMQSYTLISLINFTGKCTTTYGHFALAFKACPLQLLCNTWSLEMITLYHWWSALVNTAPGHMRSQTTLVSPHIHGHPCTHLSRSDNLITISHQTQDLLNIRSTLSSLSFHHYNLKISLILFNW